MPAIHNEALRPHERRVCRVFDSRGQPGLGEALVRMNGLPIGEFFRVESLYAAGGEGVVFLASDRRDPNARYVAKIPLVPFHKPADLSSNFLRRRREQLREEARNLERIGSRFLPRSCGLHTIVNPLLDRSRGGEFAQPEPVLVMEWMPGFDLDMWLARIHRSDIPIQMLRRNLDRVAVVLLKGLVELEDQGFHYADLRPGNLRMMGRPERRIRLLDAGSLVERGDESGRFPHVPAYLPAALFRRKHDTGETIVPTAETQAVMAGRTLFEVATGRVPLPGEEIERHLLKDSHVSAPIAEVIDGLAAGDFEDVRPALRFLEKRAVKRVPIPLDAHKPLTGPDPRTISRTGDKDPMEQTGSQFDFETREQLAQLAREAPRTGPSTLPPAAPRPITGPSVRPFSDLPPGPFVPGGQPAPAATPAVPPAAAPQRVAAEAPSSHPAATATAAVAVAAPPAPLVLEPEPAPAKRPAPVAPLPLSQAIETTPSIVMRLVQPEVLPPPKPRPWWKRLLGLK